MTRTSSLRLYLDREEAAGGLRRLAQEHDLSATQLPGEVTKPLDQTRGNGRAGRARSAPAISLCARCSVCAWRVLRRCDRPDPRSSACGSLELSAPRERAKLCRSFLHYWFVQTENTRVNTRDTGHKWLNSRSLGDWWNTSCTSYGWVWWCVHRTTCGGQMKSILDPSFRYTKSLETDLRKTFARIRRELRKQQQQQATARVEAMKKVVSFHSR